MPYACKKDQAEAAKRHYQANKSIYIARAILGKEKAKAAAKEFVLAYLLENPCVDCGEQDPIVLEFDHRPGVEKKYEIGDVFRRCLSIETIAREIEKCDVRCANCHRRRTYASRGFSHRG